MSPREAASLCRDLLDGFVLGVLMPCHHNRPYATQDPHLAWVSTSYLLSETGESEGVEAKAR